MVHQQYWRTLISASKLFMLFFYVYCSVGAEPLQLRNFALSAGAQLGSKCDALRPGMWSLHIVEFREEFRSGT